MVLMVILFILHLYPIYLNIRQVIYFLNLQYVEQLVHDFQNDHIFFHFRY